MTAIYYTPAAALSHDGCGGFLSTITNKLQMNKLIKDQKTALVRPSRKIDAKNRDITDTEINEMIERIKWRKKVLKQYGAHDTFNPRELNPDYVPELKPAVYSDYWMDGRVIG